MKQIEKKYEEMQVLLIEKYMSAHLQLNHILAFINNQQKYQQNILDNHNVDQKKHISDQLKQDDQDQPKQNNTQSLNDNQNERFSQSSRSSKEQNELPRKSIRLASTMSSQPQSPSFLPTSLTKLTQNHSQLLQQSIFQFQQLHTEQSHQLIKQQMRIQFQNQLSGYLQQYRVKIQDLQYLLNNKQSSIVSDHLPKNFDRLPKMSKMKILTKYQVELNNIKNLCAKIRSIKSEMHHQYYDQVTDKNNCIMEMQTQSQVSTFKQNINQEICNYDQIKKRRQGNIYFNDLQKTKIANEPLYPQILKLIHIENTRALALKKQYTAMNHQYKQLMKENKMFYQSYYQNNITNTLY